MLHIAFKNWSFFFRFRWKSAMKYIEHLRLLEYSESCFTSGNENNVQLDGYMWYLIFMYTVILSKVYWFFFYLINWKIDYNLSLPFLSAFASKIFLFQKGRRNIAPFISTEQCQYNWTYLLYLINLNNNLH